MPTFAFPVICIIYGLSVPVALRRVTDDNPRTQPKLNSRTQYQLLGECYVHGMMDGEAMDLLKDHQARLRDKQDEKSGENRGEEEAPRMTKVKFEII